MNIPIYNTGIGNVAWIGGIGTVIGWEWPESDEDFAGYVNWYISNAPAPAEGQCVAIFNIAGTWRPMNCNEQLGFVCEYP